MRNLVIDTGACNALRSSLVKSKEINFALSLKNKMVEKSIEHDGLTCHTIFFSLMRSNGIGDMINLYHNITNRNFMPKTRTIVMLVKYFYQHSQLDMS